MNTIAYAVDKLFIILEYAILIDVVLSWVYRGRGNQFTNIIHAITEPLLTPGRKLQEKFSPGLMIDFSPIIAFFILSILHQLILRLLAF